MKTIKITYSDGDYTITDINGTEDEIRNYFPIGQVNVYGFDDGTGWKELTRKITNVEFIGPSVHLKTKTFAQIHDQVDRFNRYAPIGRRWLKIWAIADRYKDVFIKRFGFDVCKDPSLYNTPLTRKEYAGY